METKDIQEIMVQYDEFQDSIRQPLGSILRESNPDPHLYLNLTSPKELEKCLVSLAKVTKDMFLQEVQALEAFPAAYVEPFENHCRFDCEIRNNEGCDELDCLKRWAEYSPDDFLEAIDYACDNGGGDGKGDIMKTATVKSMKTRPDTDKETICVRCGEPVHLGDNIHPDSLSIPDDDNWHAVHGSDDVCNIDRRAWIVHHL